MGGSTNSAAARAAMGSLGPTDLSRMLSDGPSKLAVWEQNQAREALKGESSKKDKKKEKKEKKKEKKEKKDKKKEKKDKKEKKSKKRKRDDSSSDSGSDSDDEYKRNLDGREKKRLKAAHASNNGFRISA